MQRRPRRSLKGQESEMSTQFDPIRVGDSRMEKGVPRASSPRSREVQRRRGVHRSNVRRTRGGPQGVTVVVRKTTTHEIVYTGIKFVTIVKRKDICRRRVEKRSHKL
ncbi:unnamed protein product [Lasius platythorax]|uniref:Uncharacterized protein n=1 Tax=Lasius platythorax TaxID=488582 RepID=A0AAV2MY16_9HYME